MNIFKKWRKAREKRRRQKKLDKILQSQWGINAPEGFDPKREGGTELDWNEYDKDVVPTYFEYDETGKCIGYKDDSSN